MESRTSKEQAPEEPLREDSGEQLNPQHLPKLIQSVDSLTESVDNLAIMIGKFITKMDEEFYYRLILEETEKQVRENERRNRNRREPWDKSGRR